MGCDPIVPEWVTLPRIGRLRAWDGYYPQESAPSRPSQVSNGSLSPRMGHHRPEVDPAKSEPLMHAMVLSRGFLLNPGPLAIANPWPSQLADELPISYPGRAFLTDRGWALPG